MPAPLKTNPTRWRLGALAGLVGALALGPSEGAWAWGAAPASQPSSGPAYGVPLRLHGPEFLNHSLSLGLRPIFFPNGVMGPSRLGGAGYVDSGAFLLDGDLRVTRKDKLFAIPLGPLGHLAPVLSSYVGLRGISAATHVRPSSAPTAKPTVDPDAPPPVTGDDALPPSPTPAPTPTPPGLVGHNVIGGIVAGTEARLELPLGFQVHAGGSLSTMLLGTWDRRNAGFLGVPEAYLGGEVPRANRGVLQVGGMVLPGASIGWSWGFADKLTLGMSYELVTVPTDLRLQTGPNVSLGKGLSAFSFVNFDVRLNALSF